MKIIYYFSDKGTLMDGWPAFHFYDELMRHGIEVELFNPLKYASPEMANVALLNRLSVGDVSLFMTPHNQQLIFSATLKSIRVLKIPTLLICFDNLIVPYMHEKICCDFDLVWLTSFENKDMFEQWGANTLFQPYAANPYTFMPHSGEDNGKVCFIGTPYGSRVNILNTLTSNNVEVDLYSKFSKESSVEKFAGNKFSYIKPFFDLVRFSHGRKIIKGAIKQSYLNNELPKGGINYYSSISQVQMSELYSNYALSLSSTTARNTGVLKKPVGVVNLRSFEIPMAGGLQFCFHNSELATYFKDGEEIVFL